MFFRILLAGPRSLLIELTVLPTGLLFKLFLSSGAFFLKLTEAAARSAGHNILPAFVLAICHIVCPPFLIHDKRKPNKRRDEATGK
jgi:hypothetical protein